MISVRRIGHATLTTPDLERGIDYYTAILGLRLLGRDRSRAIFATETGMEAIELVEGDETGLARVSFQLEPGADLEAVARTLSGHGVRAERRRDISPGIGEALSFMDPKGTSIDLFADYRFADDDSSMHTLSLLKFGHVAYRVRNVAETVSFYTDVLGFRVSDWRADNFAFLRCGVDHHTVNFVADDKPQLHHIAFEVRDWSEIQKACDFLGKRDIHLVWGPGRHNMGHNIAIYHMNPDNVRVELYCEMDQMKDEALGYFDPRPWHRDRPQRPKIWDRGTLRNYWGFGSDPNLYK